MINQMYIQAWRSVAPWQDEKQIEQDMVLTRALIELYNNPMIQKSLVFRGGTALNKLFIQPASRYSEDLDFVQIKSEAIGPVLDLIHSSIDPWLGKPKFNKKEGRMTLIYRYISIDPNINMRLKIEINTREHFSVYELNHKNIQMNNVWYTGEAAITVNDPHELMGTKFRALYQRKKGRDLFDMYVANQQLNLDEKKILHVFSEYLNFEHSKVSRAEYEENLYYKIKDERFLKDIAPLLSPNIKWDVEKAIKYVSNNLVSKLPGDPWKGHLK